MTVMAAPRGPVVSGQADDLVDWLMSLTGGCVLGTQSAGERSSHRGGEWDSRRALPTSTLRRLVGAGLISTSNGVAPDVLAQLVEVNGGPVLSGDECVEWFVTEAVRGLDLRAARRRGELGDGWELGPDPEPEVRRRPVVEREPVEFAGEVPGWVSAWLERTLCPDHAAFISALAGWEFLGMVEPVTPAAGWGPKVRAKFDRRAGV